MTLDDMLKWSDPDVFGKCTATLGGFEFTKDAEGFVEVSPKNNVGAFGDTPEDALQRLFDTLDNLMSDIRNLFYEKSRGEENNG